MSTNFPTSLDSYSTKTDNVDDVQAAHINNVQDAIEALEAKVGITSSAVTSSLDYKVNNFFASGRKVWIYENTAPTGWSYYSSVTDKVIAVKGGSQTYNVNGGNTGGQWTQPNHTLTINEIPAHTHTVTQVQGSGTPDWTSDGNALGAPSTNSGSTGGSQAHNHGTTWRPYAAVGIIIEKS